MPGISAVGVLVLQNGEDVNVDATLSGSSRTQCSNRVFRELFP